MVGSGEGRDRMWEKCREEKEGEENVGRIRREKRAGEREEEKREMRPMKGKMRHKRRGEQ